MNSYFANFITSSSILFINTNIDCSEKIGYKFACSL